MERLEPKKIAQILNITEQQLEILISLYKIESLSKRTNPKSIMTEYHETYGKRIQSSNFFTQTKQLQDKGLIKRVGAATYRIDFDNIKRILIKKREEQVKQLKEFEMLSEQTTEYFRRMAFKTIKPVVEYLDYDLLFGAITKKIKPAYRLYTVANFPTIAYSYPIANGIGRGALAEALWDRCFNKGELEIFYLTTLDVDFPFNHAFRVYGDPKLAYNECKIVLEQLRNQIGKYENLHVRYIKEQHGMDVLIPEGRGPREFFLFTRDEHKNVQGGIHIKSPETTVSAKNSFMRDYEYAEEIKGKKGEEILTNVRKQMDERYGVIEG